jgi:4-carboxymuconolactone decarboxylase
MALRIKPLELPLDDEHASMLRKWMPAIPGIDPLALFRVLIRNPKLSENLHPLGAFQLGKESSLPLQDRELVINRTCARCGCEYEWGVHTALLGAHAGFEPTMIAATVKSNADDPIWSARQTCLIAFVDSLHDTGTVTDELWRQLSEYWTEEQTLELAVLAGYYHAISFVANMAGLIPETWAQRFPE